MEGFTALSEKLGIEEAYSIMDQVYEILIHKVHDYEGTVNEMTGDGIMALFGAPIALEDAPQRAVRSGLAIHREIAKFSDSIKQEIEGTPSLKMRIGIHTGPVVVGTLGNDLRVEFKAVGDTVNLSSKIEALMEAFKRIILKGSEIRPLIMAHEGLHWTDKSSEDLLKYLIEIIPAARVLMIFTYRPEFVHTWGGKSFHSQVTLNRLSNRESIIMVTNLLGTEDIDSNLVELILEKTERIPFFIDEFIRSLKDLKVLETENNKCYLAKDIQDMAIPTTIQDVIMARVDSLPEEAKVILQTGSVVGKEFSHDLIKRVTDLPEQEMMSHSTRENEILLVLLEIEDPARGKWPLDWAWAKARIGMAFERLGKFEDGLRTFLEAKKVLEGCAGGQNSVEMSKYLSQLGWIYFRLRNCGEASAGPKRVSVWPKN